MNFRNLCLVFLIKNEIKEKTCISILKYIMKYVCDKTIKLSQSRPQLSTDKTKLIEILKISCINIGRERSVSYFLVILKTYHICTGEPKPWHSVCRTKKICWNCWKKPDRFWLPALILTGKNQLWQLKKPKRILGIKSIFIWMRENWNPCLQLWLK